MAWDDAKRERAVSLYEKAEPTPESSLEIIKEIAEELEETTNGVRMVLVKAGVYVKKEEAAAGTKTEKKAGSGTGRVSKEAQISELKKLIEAKGKEIDEEILGKLTGKAAAYLVSVFK